MFTLGVCYIRLTELNCLLEYDDDDDEEEQEEEDDDDDDDTNSNCILGILSRRIAYLNELKNLLKETHFR